MPALPELPNDVATLQGLIDEGRQVRQALEEALRQRDAEIRTLKVRLAAALERKESLRRAAAGPRSAQLEFRLEEPERLAAEDAAAAAGAIVHHRQHSASVARERVIESPLPADAAELCPACGAPLQTLAEDVSEMLEYGADGYRLISHVRPKLHCARCRQSLQAPPPPRPLPRVLAGPAMLARVLIGKYAQRWSLYRQRRIYAAAGVTVDRSTLADWLEATWRLLEPLVDALMRHVLAATHLQVASAPYPVLTAATGRVRLGRMWVYVRDERPWGSKIAPTALVRFAAERGAVPPRAHLAGFTGSIQGPGLTGATSAQGGWFRELGCWGALRSRIASARDASAEVRAPLLEHIEALYQIEQSLSGKPPQERCAVRRAEAAPLLTELRALLPGSLRQLPKQSPLAAALRAALGHWDTLCAYAADGRAELDGLEGQRVLDATIGGGAGRGGVDTHGARAAGIYTLIATARLNALEPERYLRAVLSRIGAEPIGRIEQLLPWSLSGLGDVPIDAESAGSL